GGVNASLSLRGRHPLHAVSAGFEFQAREHTAAHHAADDFAIAAVLAGALAERLDLPPLALGIAAVHAQQIAAEEGGLIATGARADFQIDIALVALITRQQQALQVPLPPLERAAHEHDLFGSQAANVGILVVGH